MFFKRIEIHGFKSFADPITIEFDRGITCIVGPNGSGKSNICDAIRWVLGAQSAKALRGEKMEDVIFAGTTSRKSRGMAEVTLVIDNSEGELNIDYNEVAITRRMYRSGESEYLINNNPCRMRDIRQLIMDTGIGVEGYSIIGQGKISDIISNNTESIREILEEAAGIVSYRSRKADAERKLNAATNNMERVQDIINEIEGRIDGLKEDSEKATEYLKLRDRHKQLEINITLKNIEKIEESTKEIAADLENLKVQIKETSAKRAKASELLLAQSAKREELDNKLENAREKQMTIVGLINDMVNKNEIKAERLAALERSNKQLKLEISELEEKIASERENSRSMIESKAEWDKKLEGLKKKLNDKIDEHRAETEKLTELGFDLERKRNENFETQSIVNRKTVEIASLETLLSSLEDRKKAVIERGSDMPDSSATDKQLDDAKVACEAIKKEIEALKQSKEDKKNQFAIDSGKEREIHRLLQESQIEAGKITARKKTMEELESNYDGYNNAVKFIMKEKIRGINGVVADLIHVPKGYETAIEVALGATVQNIVCETDDVAKKAVNLLKDNKAGRLTFLPVESIVPREVPQLKEISSAKGFKGYGCECVSYDEKYENVMKYLLGNVVVVDNMDNAIALSKKSEHKYKLVTLEGEIINNRGAITGGKLVNNSANLFERKAEIDELADKLSDIAKEQEKYGKQLKHIAEDIEAGKNNIMALEIQISDTERELFAKENEVKLIMTAISDYESNRSRQEEELANIEKEQVKAKENSTKLAGEIENDKERAATLEAEIAELVDAYKLEQEQIAVLNDEITSARIEVSSCENEKATVDALVAKVNETVAGFEYEKGRKENILNGQETERAELESHGKDSSEEIEKQKEDRKSLEKLIEDIIAERTLVTAACDETTREKDELDKKALSLSNQKTEIEIKQARFDTQLENSRNKLWEEFELSYAQALDYKDPEFAYTTAIKENRDIKRRITELGEVNVGAIVEYKAVSERYSFLTAQADDIKSSMDELNKIISDMDRIIKARFNESFEAVVNNFEEVFRELLGGGHAKLEIGDEKDPFNSEIIITAQPPGKQLRNINLLSGGEKTMTAIALMFAVLKTKSTPCCILDEIEAALDDVNLDIFGNYVRKFEGVQFTLITHQKATMEHADVMYGVTMPERGVTKVYSLKMTD